MRTLHLSGRVRCSRSATQRAAPMSMHAQATYMHFATRIGSNCSGDGVLLRRITGVGRSMAPGCNAVRYQTTASSSGGGDLYSQLGVSSSATHEEIKAAYKKLALQYHPDRNGGDDSKFKEISQAYNVLGNKDRRREYDAMKSFGGGMGGGGGQQQQQHPDGGYSVNYDLSGRGGRAGPFPGSSSGFHAQRMSKEEAEQLFRDMFGNRNLHDLFRDFENLGSRRPGGFSPMGSGAFGPTSTNAPGQNPFAFRPFFSQTSSRTWTDASGYTTTEQTVRSPDGTFHRVYSHKDAEGNMFRGSSPGKEYEPRWGEEIGGVRQGHPRANPAFEENFKFFSFDYRQANPLVSMMYLSTLVLIGSALVVGFFVFLYNHPEIFALILAAIILRRMR